MQAAPHRQRREGRRLPGCRFFCNDTATPEIYTLSLHDALPICSSVWLNYFRCSSPEEPYAYVQDRKSTRLNSSHTVISYAVFCLKKKRLSQPFWRGDNLPALRFPTSEAT